MTKWNDELYDEDMEIFLDVMQGADEIDGQWTGPVFYRNWKVTEETLARGLRNLRHNIEEMPKDSGMRINFEQILEIIEEMDPDILIRYWTVVTDRNDNLVSVLIDEE